MFGTRVTRVEDQALLTGSGAYVADLDLPGCLTVGYVTAPVAHARITHLDVSAARRAPGVVDVVTWSDLDVGPAPTLDPGFPAAMARPLLCSGVVRFVGEAIVAVVAESTAAAADAADLVEIDYDPRPAVVTVDDALADTVLLFEEAGTNVVATGAGGGPEADPGACEVVVRAAFVSSRVAPCPMEGRAAASRWEGDGRLTHWSACQGAYPVRAVLCGILGLDPRQVRVIVPEVGGSFGAKARPYPEEVLLPWLARRVGRPVRWVPPRSQDMVGLGHSRAQRQEVELGGRRDGTLEALRVRIVADCGAYPLSAPILARNTGSLAGGAYTIPAVAWESVSVVTNTTPITAYRGAGRPEAAAIVERAVDLFAAEIGLDPAEVRRRNLIPSDGFPFQTATGLRYDSGNYRTALESALDQIGYDDVRAEQARRRRDGDEVQVGIGLATFVDRTAGVAGAEYGAVELRPDGGFLVRTGSTPYGQGHRTAWAMLVAERTGVGIDRIEVVYGDTDLVPKGGVTGGSRSAQKAGSAVAAATDGLVEQARGLAADLLEAAPEDLVLDVGGGGRFHVAGSPSRSLGWSDVAGAVVARADADAPAPTLACEADVETDATFPFGAYVAVCEVDVSTGAVTVRRLVTVDDAGRILNPLLAEGQVHGGVVQGVAQALLEQFVYDDDGNPLTGTFLDYGIPSAAEMPAMESSFVETPSPNNPLGVKGIAESGTIGAPPAVQNAVVDAVRHLGVTHIDMPCTPLRVWEALRAVSVPG